MRGRLANLAPPGQNLRVEINTLEGLTRLLQASISPVALVSGVGLLILSQTNRFSRIVDRLRELARRRRERTDADAKLERQIAIFRRRARILRLAISGSLTCVLLASVLVLALFAAAALNLDLQLFVLLLFALSLVCLIGSLVLFLQDMRLSLQAVEAELAE